MKKVYMNIFDKLWLLGDTYITLADGWVFTDKYSHEFQVILPVWEDEIYICDGCGTSHNKEIIDEKSWFVCTNCKSKNHRIEKASEVWNIFPLETKFSGAFDMKMTTEDNREKEVLMWCYGIWISRLMWVIAEYFMTDSWISWPDSIAPAEYYIIVLWEENLEKATQFAEKLEEKWKSVILDDRMWKKFWFWQKATDCDLFWIPKRIVISSKTIQNWGFEFTPRWWESEIIKF
jgi:prolyl-tRNA synthetase